MLMTAAKGRLAVADPDLINPPDLYVFKFIQEKWSLASAARETG